MCASPVTRRKGYEAAMQKIPAPLVAAPDSRSDGCGIQAAD
jgi:hypothetical protein